MATTERCVTERGTFLSSGPRVAQDVGPAEGSKVWVLCLLHIISAHLQFILVSKGSLRNPGGLPEAPTPRLVKGIVPNCILLMDPNFGFRSLFSALFTLSIHPRLVLLPRNQRPASLPLLLTSCASLSRVPPLSGSHFPWGEMRAESRDDVAASWTCHQPGQRGGECPSLLPTSLSDVGTLLRNCRY